MKPYTPLLFRIGRARFRRKATPAIPAKKSMTLPTAHQTGMTFPTGHPVREYILKPNKTNNKN